MHIALAGDNIKTLWTFWIWRYMAALKNLIWICLSKGKMFWTGTAPGKIFKETKSTPRFPRPNAGHKEKEKEITFFSSFVFLLAMLIYGWTQNSTSGVSPKWVKSNERRRRRKKETMVSIYVRTKIILKKVVTSMYFCPKLYCLSTWGFIYNVYKILIMYKCQNWTVWHIWQLCPSHSISVHENDVYGGFTFISYPVDETFSNLTWRLFSIWTIYDYRWVEIAYGLEKIVLMPRTWSVRIFAKKTACLVA